MNGNHRASSNRGRGRGRRGGGRGGRGRRGRGNDNSFDGPPTNPPEPQGSGGGRRGGVGRNSNSNGGGRGRFGGRRAPVTDAPRPRPQQPMLKNGDKGADAFTVSEATRISFTKKLMDFRESSASSDTATLEFPSTLTNTERKFLHQLASNLGLKSISTGKGENRHITVTKRNHEQSSVVDQMPRLVIGKAGAQALKQHVQLYPPTHAEELESRETGASILEALQSTGNDNDDKRVASALQEMHLGDRDVLGPLLFKKNTRVNLDRRRSFHAQAKEQKRKHPHYAKMMQQREKLPAFKHEQEIVQAIATHQITIVSGETGSGKSTQTPQFLLDALRK